jgi:hypothetical protein
MKAVEDSESYSYYTKATLYKKEVVYNQQQPPISCRGNYFSAHKK